MDLQLEYRESIGGLAEGLYTVYVATQPVAANDLSGVQYSDVQIQLSKAVTTGNLVVSSSPINAQVSLDGKYMGNTPLTLTDLAPGDYSILLELQGYRSSEDRVVVIAGQTATYSVTLEPVQTPGTRHPLHNPPLHLRQLRVLLHPRPLHRPLFPGQWQSFPSGWYSYGEWRVNNCVLWGVWICLLHGKPNDE